MKKDEFFNLEDLYSQYGCSVQVGKKSIELESVYKSSEKKQFKGIKENFKSFVDQSNEKEFKIEKVDEREIQKKIEKINKKV